MLIKKKENNGIIDALYESSNVLASNYNKNTKDLIITFIKGTRYRYKNVLINDYFRFELAESQGIAFTSHIKNHEVEKLSNVDAITLLNEIKTTIKDEQEALLKLKYETMISSMRSIIEAVDSNSIISENYLTLVRDNINSYLIQLNQNTK